MGPKAGEGGQGRTCQDRAESNDLRFTDGATVYLWANKTPEDQFKIAKTL